MICVGAWPGAVPVVLNKLDDFKLDDVKLADIKLDDSRLSAPAATSAACMGEVSIASPQTIIAKKQIYTILFDSERVFELRLMLATIIT